MRHGCVLQLVSVRGLIGNRCFRQCRNRRRVSGVHANGCFRQGCHGGCIGRVYADGCFRQRSYGGCVSGVYTHGCFRQRSHGGCVGRVYTNGCLGKGGYGRCVGGVHANGCFRQGSYGGCVSGVYTHGCFRQGSHGGRVRRVYTNGCLGQGCHGGRISGVHANGCFRQRSHRRSIGRNRRNHGLLCEKLKRLLSIKRAVLSTLNASRHGARNVLVRGIQCRRNIRRNLHLRLKDTVVNLRSRYGHLSHEAHTLLGKTTGNPHIRIRHHHAHTVRGRLTGVAGTAHLQHGLTLGVQTRRIHVQNRCGAILHNVHAQNLTAPVTINDDISDEAVVLRRVNQATGNVMGRSRRAVLERALDAHRLNRVQKRETPMVCLVQCRGESGSFRGQFRRLERNLVQTQGGLQLTGIGLNLVVVDRNNRRVIRIRGIRCRNRRQSAQAQGCGKKNRSAGATVAAGTRRVSHHEVPSTWVIE